MCCGVLARGRLRDSFGEVVIVVFRSSYKLIFSRQEALDRPNNGGLAAPATGFVHSASHQADNALDAALRSVPLPEGLMTRLNRLARVMTDEAPDQCDWHGTA